MEGVVGIGITASPVLGSFVYSAVGFSQTFFIFGALMAPSSLLALCTMPSVQELKRRNGHEEERAPTFLDKQDEQLLKNSSPKKKSEGANSSALIDIS